MTVIEGGNFRIDVTHGVASCRVWRRPDVDSATGARFAEDKAKAFAEILQGGARAMLFDLSDAPVVAGPKTEGVLGEMVALFERAGRPIAVVVGAAPVCKLQMERITQTHAPRHGRVFVELRSAEDWIRDAMSRKPISGPVPTSDRFGSGKR